MEIHYSRRNTYITKVALKPDGFLNVHAVRPLESAPACAAYCCDFSKTQVGNFNQQLSNEIAQDEDRSNLTKYKYLNRGHRRTVTTRVANGIKIDFCSCSTQIQFYCKISVINDRENSPI